MSFPFRVLTGACLFFLFALSLVAGQVVTRPKVNFCYIPRFSSTNAMSAMHSAFAVDYYRSTATAVDFTFRYVSKYGTGNIDVKAAMHAILANGTDCHVWFGPGSSRISTTVSTVIETAWVDYASTSLELSDKTQHPFFSRVVPSDSFGGEAMAAIVKHFNWKTVSILCGDEAYGRSITGAFTSSFTAAADSDGEVIETSRCLTVDATEDDFVAALQETFIPAASRIVVVALLSTGRDNFIQAALRIGFHKTHVIVFAESACSGNLNWLQLPGALCTTFSTEASGANAGWPAAYAAKSYSFVTDLVAAGTPLDRIRVNDTSVYAEFAHDAVKHVMLALHGRQLLRADLDPSNATQLMEVIRSSRSDGLSGVVFLDTKGDRVHSEMKVLNAQPNAQEVNIGIWRTSGIALNQRVYWLDSQYDNAPNDRKAKAAGEEKDSTNLIVGVAVGLFCLLLLIIAIVVFVFFILMKPARDVGNAPKDDSQAFSIVFTDIQSSTALWARVPMEMAAGVELHHRIIRDQIKRFNGYEVKTIGDSFMVTFTKTSDAIAFAVSTQWALKKADWGTTAFDDVYADLEEENKLERTVQENHRRSKLWNGLRVRMGVHAGYGEIQYDDVAMGYDYYGTVVNTAARIESAGNGGQVIVSESCYQSTVESSKVRGLPPVDGEQLVTVDLGAQNLRGLDLPVTMHQVLPHSLSERKFGPLRLDADEPDVGQQGSDDSESLSSSMRGGGVGIGFGQEVEAMAQREAKKCGLARAVAYSELLSNYCFARALFSTSSGKFRQQAIDTIGKQWSVPKVQPLGSHQGSKHKKGGGTEKSNSRNTEQDQYLMAIVIKTSPAAELNFRKFSGMSRGGTASNATSVHATPQQQPMSNPLAGNMM